MIIAHHPVPSSEGVEDGLSLVATSLIGIDDLDADNTRIHDADVLVVELMDQPTRRLRELGRIEDTVGLPVLAVAAADQLGLLDSATGISDFITHPVDPVELRLRLSRLSVNQTTTEVVVFKDLELNPLTYQATLGSEPLDLTFMEYELLRFLVENPIRVWSREQLLSKVWGYDYYGGARTVDVHVRRLRSKLGEERSSWITTVRSVGYRFG